MDSILDGFDFHRLSLYQDLARVRPVVSKKGQSQLSPARTQQPGNAQNLPRIQFEVNILEVAPLGQVPHLKQNVLASHVWDILGLLDLLSGHEHGQLLVV